MCFWPPTRLPRVFRLASRRPLGDPSTMRVWLVAIVGPLLGAACLPKPRLDPALSSTALAGAAAVELRLSRREVCWPAYRDPEGAGGHLSVLARATPTAGAVLGWPWTIERAADRHVMRTIAWPPAANANPSSTDGLVEVALSLDGLTPGHYLLVVPVRAGEIDRRAEVGIEVLPCVFY